MEALVLKGLKHVLVSLKYMSESFLGHVQLIVRSW